MRETTIRVALDIHGEDALDRYRLVASRISEVPDVLEVTEEIVCTRPEFSFVRMQVRHRFNTLEAAQRVHSHVMDLVSEIGDYSLVDFSSPISSLEGLTE